MLAVVPALGTLKVNAQPDKSAREQYVALLEQYQKLQAEFSKQYNSAKTAEERKELLDKRPDAAPFAEKMLALAGKNLNDSAVAMDALVWVMQSVGNGKLVERANEMVEKNFLIDPAIVKALPVFSRNVPGNDKVLQTILEKNPDKAVQGLACYYLAQNLKNQAQAAERQKNTEAAAGMMKLAEAKFERVAKDYGDVQDPRDSKGKRLRDLVEPELFELRFLTVGKTAPDIAAEDLDGKTFKLSDYRGKVVLLDFWGHW